MGEGGREERGEERGGGEGGGRGAGEEGFVLEDEADSVVSGCFFFNGINAFKMKEVLVSKIILNVINLRMNATDLVILFFIYS